MRTFRYLKLPGNETRDLSYPELRHNCDYYKTISWFYCLELSNLLRWLEFNQSKSQRHYISLLESSTTNATLLSFLSTLLLETDLAVEEFGALHLSSAAESLPLMDSEKSLPPSHKPPAITVFAESFIYSSCHIAIRKKLLTALTFRCVNEYVSIQLLAIFYKITLLGEITCTFRVTTPPPASRSEINSVPTITLAWLNLKRCIG